LTPQQRNELVRLGTVAGKFDENSTAKAAHEQAAMIAELNSWRCSGRSSSGAALRFTRMRKHRRGQTPRTQSAAPAAARQLGTAGKTAEEWRDRHLARDRGASKPRKALLASNSSR